MEYDVIIVGAGASGLVAAIAAARQERSVLVIERKEKAGKKILATGNGKCNYTNLAQTPECYRSDDSAYAMKVLSCFDVNQTLNFFEELGIYPRERNGYYYPNSEQAVSMVQVLVMECERLKVDFRLNETVIGIKNPDFTIITEQVKPPDENRQGTNHKSERKGAQIQKSEVKINSYQGKTVILAAGGCASSQLGSDGSGYYLAKGLGHSLIKPLPALVQLKSSDQYCKTISGVRTLASVTAYADQKQIAQETGEILFTDYGISGIPVMQISRFAAKALDIKLFVCLVIDFFPELSIEQLRDLIRKRLQQNRSKTIEEMMVGLLNHKLSYILIKQANLDPSKKSNSVTEKEVEGLINQIKQFRMNITGTNSFENAQVCAGGIRTGEIEPGTMESKLVKNLFLTGELIDVDGTCGGYNLQWAWSTGFLAGTAAGKVAARTIKNRKGKELS